MAVEWVREVWDGRGGGGDFDGNIEHTRVWKAKTDSKWDDQTTVLTASSLPFLGQAHPNDLSSYCNSLTATNVGETPFLWIVTATYSNEREGSASPLDDPIEYEWSTEQYQEVADRDASGQGIVNSAGDPFDPPIMRDVSRLAVTITSNQAFVPLWIITYQDAVNSSTCGIDGLTIAAGQAKCQSISVSGQRERNGFPYRIVRLTIHINKDGWKRSQLDAGFRERDDENKLKLITSESDGGQPPGPVLLDGNGAAILDPSPGDAVFLEFDLYTELDFGALPGIIS